MSWPPELDANWEDARPIPTGALGSPEDPEHFHDPYTRCEGVNYAKLDGFSARQKQRLNKLARRLGYLSSCQHDLTQGVLLSELQSGVDGPEHMNELYTGSIERMVTGLAAMRPVL